MKEILSCVLIACMAFTGCIATDTGRGAEFIEDLSQEQFNLVNQEIYLIVEIGVRELIRNEHLKKEDVLKAAQLISATTTLSASETIIIAVRDSLSESVGNDALASILQLVELEIRRLGGFTVIRADDGTFYFSDRSKALLLTLATALSKASV